MNKKLLILGMTFLLGSCAEVKSYQRVYLNDSDMTTSDELIQSYETNFQTYRESASGGSSAKAGGGCGCN